MDLLRSRSLPEDWYKTLTFVTKENSYSQTEAACFMLLHVKKTCLSANIGMKEYTDLII